MLRSYILNNYLGKEFLKVIFNTSLIFFCLGFVLNLFEEINFFKDYNTSFQMPIFLTMLFVPSLLYNMFPFVVLISGIWFFLKIKKTDEVIALKVSGISNLSVIIIPGILSFILGIIFVTSLNPIISVLVKKYENIKGSYQQNQEYLSSITVNGIWIKEKNLGKNSLIRAVRLEDKKLIGISIYQFDNDNNFIQRIEAKSADISSLLWVIEGGKVIDKKGKITSKYDTNLTYKSNYDLKKLKSVYKNIDTISFWNLNKEIKKIEASGYSTSEMKAKFQQYLSFPCFLLSMILLSGVFTLGVGFKENNWIYVFLTIISSVLIFYFVKFSAALGQTDKLPIEISVWMPIIIIFIFSGIGLLHVNEK